MSLGLSTSEWLMFFTAVATALAAWAAARGARATRDAAEGQLLSTLYHEFWSDEFRRAGRLLADLEERFESFGHLAFARAFVKFRQAQGPPKESDESDLPAVVDRDDSARRTVKSYYYKLYRFVEADLLSEAEVRDLLTSEVNVGLFLRVVEPMEEALSDELGHRGYEKEQEIFDFFDNLYDRRPERPLR